MIEEYYYQTAEPYLQGTQEIKILQIYKSKIRWCCYYE